MVSINSAIDVIPIPVANGGTGLATLTAHAVQLGNGTSAPVQLAVGATGTLLQGATGADPAFTATPSGLTSVTSTSFVTSSATVGTTYTDNSITPTGSDANTSLLVNGKGSGGVVHSRGIVGGNVTMQATNTDNTNGASRGGFEAAVGGTSGGDPYYNWLISGGQTFTMGIDNSTTNDDFVLSKNAALGTTNVVSFDGSTSAATFAGAITSTVGAITATNGNVVLNTAGNKLISTSVGSAAAAGANSFGTVTLVAGTVTVATTAVTANSIVFLTRTSVGATGANDLGMLSVGTIVAGTSFDINAWTVTNATALQTDDVSVVGWMIVN